MIKNSILSAVILLSFFLSASGQELFYKSYDWGKPDSIPGNFQDKEKVTMFLKNVVEFAFQGDYFLEYDLEHKITYINSDEEVKQNNTIYLYYNQHSTIVSAKARVIKPNNEVIELDSTKMLDSYDEETGNKYKYFALEGLEKGSIVEVLHVIAKSPVYQGRRIYIQEEDSIANYEFDLFAPSNLFFEFNVINDTNTVQRDTLIANHWILKLQHIAGLEKEASAPFNTLLKQLVYKLNRNTANNTRDISSYGQASQNIYSNIYQHLDKKDTKALAKFIKSIPLDKNASLDDQIYWIENYVKNNINIADYSSDELKKISAIIENKTASGYGLTKLLANIYKALDIDHQIVLTSDRSNIPFDPKFEAFNYLQDYLIYFPKTKKFMSPEKFEYRYGLPYYYNANNYGLFIKRISLGGMESGLGKIKFIPPAGYQQTHHDHFVTATINDDFSDVTLDVTTSSTGYFACPLQPYIDLISEDALKKLMDDGVKNYIPNSNINQWGYENVSRDVIGKEPFITKYNITNSDLINEAGDIYLFKVGLLIGPQQELYSEKTRRLPVYDNYKRTFDRELRIIIPEGYVVKNPGDLDIFAEYVVDGVQRLQFKSTHTYEGNEIKISIHEYYDQIEYSVDEYPFYRKVVNSASDFNKVILAIVKK